ncbi:unnamed protein product [Cunninghamella blakesleeana]
MVDRLTITPPPEIIQMNEQVFIEKEQVEEKDTIEPIILPTNTASMTMTIVDNNNHNTNNKKKDIDTPPTPTLNTNHHPCESCDHWENKYILQLKETETLKKDLNQHDDELKRLQQDMQFLNKKYVSAIDRVADIQHEKDLVEHDLEELSCKLFEEANDMVAVEKKERWLLEKELKVVKQQLIDEKAQLHELRQRLLQWDNDHHLHHQKQKQLKKKKSNSLMTTALKEEDESILDQHHHDHDHEADGEDNEEEDHHYHELKKRNNVDNNNNEDDEEEEEGEEDDQFEDAVENLEDPQIRAKHDLALLHGLTKKKKRSSKMNHHDEKKDSTTMTNNKKKQQLRSVSMPPPPSTLKKQYTITPTVDQIQLEAFQQFVHSSSNVPLKKLYQFAYMKYCQLEDVEPCLRFGPHSRLSVKKMMDYLLHQPCFIEQMSIQSMNETNDQPVTTMIPSSVAQRSLIWDRWQNSLTSSHSNSNLNNSSKSKSSTTTTMITPIGCAACGRPKENNHENNNNINTLYYQFKLDEKDDWLPIDQYCRDRLVAVCEFFVFIRNIHLRLYTHRSIDDLYSENIRLRLQMFYSRMGALPVILEGMGLNADAVGKASNPQDQGYESAGSVSK